MLRILAIVLVLAGSARAEPDNRDLFYIGLALAPPTYILGVGLHEGSHAVAAKLVGAEVMSVRIFPPGRDPRANKFRFGWTYVRGLKTRGDKQFFYLAPKITDALLLGGFAALVFTDAWPSNPYARLGLTVFATGLWVDFSKDVILFHPANDVVKIFRGWCMTGWRQIPARLVYAGMIAGLARIVVEGYRETFVQSRTQDVPLVLPVIATSF
jgi:hypothetical protein